MKVSIYNENPKKEEPKFLLRLVQIGQDVQLLIVNSEGIEKNSGILLEITKNMELRRTGHINSTLGLPLNGNKQLKLEEGDN